jgi:ABC-type Mn2+/Zn2+ transport system ATPase subunit
MHHPIVEFRDVSYTYGEDAVLDRVTVVIREGAFVGVVGPSGAGKSTFLKLAAGTLRPSRGRVLFGPDGAQRRVRMGVVPQTEAIDWNFPVTAEEVVLLGRAADGGALPWASRGLKREAREVLDKLGIGHLAHRHIRNLSGGQQQRVFIARALIRKPELLLLDEPTSGVDVKTRHDVLHLLHSLNHEGIAIVITTHDLSAVAAHLPSLICLNRRVVASGRPQEVLTSANLRELYGAEMVVVEQDGMLLIGDVPSASLDVHDRAEHAEGVAAAHFGEEPPPHDHGPEADHRHEDQPLPERAG